MFQRRKYVPRGITASGLFAIERRFWAAAVGSLTSAGSLAETLVLVRSDEAEFVHTAEPGSKLSDSQDILRAEVAELEIDAVLHLGFNPVASRLSLYNYWHSVSGRRVRIAEVGAGFTVTERDMRRATGLHSWVEELF